MRGVVFADLNGNGNRDGSERGLANVVVSKQDDMVATDSAGQYEIPVGPSRIDSTLPVSYR